MAVQYFCTPSKLEEGEYGVSSEEYLRKTGELDIAKRTLTQKVIIGDVVFMTDGTEKAKEAAEKFLKPPVTHRRVNSTP